MCLKRVIAAVVPLLVVASTAFAQTALERLEGTLQTKPAPAAAPAAEAVPAEAPQPYLGFVPNETIDDGKGVRVEKVSKGGPAELGGLRAGDLITAIDGKAVKNLTDFDAIYATATAGQKLRMTVERAAKAQTLTITLGTRPAAAAAAPPKPRPASSAPPITLTDPADAATKPALDPSASPADPLDSTPKAPIRSKPAETKPLDLGLPPADVPAAAPGALDPLAAPGAAPLPADALPTPAAMGRPSLGITVVPLTDEARAAYGLSVRRGALIRAVRPGSPADTAGVPVGGVVVALDGKRVDTADELVAAIRTLPVGTEVELTYYVGADLARKSLRLAPAAAGIAAAPGVGLPPTGGLTPSGPLDLKLGGPDRPLLNKVEQLVDGITSPRTAPGALPRGPSTVYDPSEMAAIRDQVLQLEEKITALEERVKLLEAKLGADAPAANPAP